jgi:trehalose/maltose hydrolase-like predicted phosphorylase
MLEALQPTQDPDWVLSHEGYNVLTESAFESRFAFGNGFLGMRAARSVSRGPTWIAWLGYSRWASWPRCYVAGLFDVPYEPRCAHGSSLSTGMHALVAARLGDAAMALHYLRATAASDLDFDPNSAGGVRIAGLGALWQAVILGFAGLDLKGDMLGVDPRLPPQWRSLSFRVCWRGRSVAIRITDGIVQAMLVEGEGMEMRIGAATRTLAPGATLQVSV